MSEKKWSETTVKRPGFDDLARDTACCKRILGEVGMNHSREHRDLPIFSVKPPSTEPPETLAMEVKRNNTDSVNRICGSALQGNPGDLQPLGAFLGARPAANVVQ